MYNGKVNRIVDGDTVIIDVDLGFNVWLKESTRLAEINAGERGTVEGQKAKDRITELLPLGAPIRLEVRSFDRYSRAVSQIYVLDAKGIPSPKSISTILLEENLVSKYK